MTRIVPLAEAEDARGLVVVVDVIRAFTSAAFAFGAGAREVLPVGGIDEAFSLRERLGDALLMGENEGLPIEGFDYSNSPAELEGADLAGRRLVQRTTSGTQGVVRSSGADEVLVASFVCAAATVERARRHPARDVTFVVTSPGNDGGDEDRTCAEYLAALLDGRPVDPQPYLDRVTAAAEAQKFADPALPEYPAEDLPRCVDLDRFGFAMPVTWRDGQQVIQPQPAPQRHEVPEGPLLD